METSEKQTKRDHSRNATSEKINEEIDKKTETNLLKYKNNLQAEEIEKRIVALEKEWDIDRTLMANASTVSLAGVVLGATVSKKWFILPGVVASFLLLHAVQGWCPPLPIFRKLGYRTRKEIDTEKYALKALRGDFALLDRTESVSDAILVERALHAAKK